MILFILLPVLLAVAITSGMVLFEKMNKFVFDSIEVEELEIGRKEKLIPLLVSRTEKNMLGKTKTTKFYVDDKKNIIQSTYYADTGKLIDFNECEYNSVGPDHYPNRKFLTNLESDILSRFNKKVIDENIDFHYEKVIENLDKELNDKFSKLEKEKEVVAKYKARISPEDINSDLEEFVSNVENVFKKGKQKSARR